MAMSGHVVHHAHRLAPAAPEEEYVYGACAPSWHSAGSHETVVDQWIAAAREAGIERVVCLVPGRTLDDEDTGFGRYREAFGPENVLHAPVPDRRLVSRGRLREVIPFLEESVDAGRPVVVHGLAGLSRTGQVLAAWLVVGRDYTPREAVETVREMGRAPLAAVDGASEEDLLDVLAGL